MNILSKTKAIILGLVLVLGFSSAVYASPIIVYEKVEFIDGFATSNESFTVPVAGSYLATLTDFGIPVPFDFLLFAVTTTTTPMGSLMTTSGSPGSDSFVFDAMPGVTYFANVAGDAGVFDSMELSLFGADVRLVPLPASALLFASGLIGFAWFRMRARK